MFLESAKQAGWIEVICGSMFSGKTEELIRRLKRAKFANQKVEIFKPAIDIRYSEEEVVSHDSHSILSTPVDASESILLLTGDVEVVHMYPSLQVQQVCHLQKGGASDAPDFRI